MLEISVIMTLTLDPLPSPFMANLIEKFNGQMNINFAKTLRGRRAK